MFDIADNRRILWRSGRERVIRGEEESDVFPHCRGVSRDASFQLIISVIAGLPSHSRVCGVSAV